MSGGSIGATTKSTTKGAEDGQKVRVMDKEPCAGKGMPLAGNSENVRNAVSWAVFRTLLLRLSRFSSCPFPLVYPRRLVEFPLLGSLS